MNKLKTAKEVRLGLELDKVKILRKYIFSKLKTKDLVNRHYLAPVISQWQEIFDQRIKEICEKMDMVRKSYQQFRS